MKANVETYGLKKEEDPLNPLIPIIEDMFSNELHESQWRRYTVEKTIELLKEKMKNKDIKFTERHYLLLKRRIDRCKKMEDCLKILTDTILGELSEK
jgi:hypothetical protein